MKILVIDIAASEGGALTVLKEFYNYVVQNDKQNQYIFWISDEYIDPRENIKVEIFKNAKKNHINRLYFDFIVAEKYVKKINPDVIFSLQNLLPRGKMKIPQVVYMHQSIPFQDLKNYSFFKKNEIKLAIIQKVIGKMIKQSIKQADEVIVQTEWIRRAVIEKTNINEKKIHTVFPDVKLPHIEENREYIYNDFFYPAIRVEYKNHRCIERAIEILNSKGIYDFKVYLTIDGEDSSNVKYIGKLSQSEVYKIMQCSTLLFPSYIETVGLPMLESRALGSIICASDCPFSHEVLDGYKNVYFFNPFNPVELAEYMEKIICKKIIKKDDKLKINNKNSWADVMKIICKTV